MKKLLLLGVFLSVGASVWATTSTKGETSHPVYKHAYTYE